MAAAEAVPVEDKPTICALYCLSSSWDGWLLGTFLSHLAAIFSCVVSTNFLSNKKIMQFTVK